MKSVNYIRTNEWIAYFVGLAITILFIVFATPFYELLYPGSAQFGNDMYNQNMYFVIAILTSAIIWLVAILYYLVIDRWSSFVSWAIFALIATGCAPCITYVYPNGEFMDLGIDLSADLVNFAIVNSFVALVFYFIISFCLKGMSRNCATTPF